MNNKQFYQKLQEKLPHWQAQGWLNKVSAQNILDDTLLDVKHSGPGLSKTDLSEQEIKNGISDKSHKLSLILGVMGVMLLSAGAISFFAANWQGMSKLFKLSLLFSSMTGAYLAAAWALSGQRYPALGQSLLLLGVLLFGNNIMLIAQIYHIDSHYPDGILLWSAGALMTSIIMRSETVLIAAAVLALLWSGIEIFDFRQIHWLWLIFWSISAVITIRQRFQLATHFIILSLFFWLLFSFNNFTRYASDGCIVQLYLLLGLVIYMLARTIKFSQYGRYFLDNLSRYAFVFCLIFLYVLSFPGLDLYPSLSHTSASESSKTQLSWLIIHLALIVLVIILSLVHLKQVKKPVALYKWLGILWLFILFSTLLLNIYWYQDSLFQNKENYTVIIVNLLLFLLVIGLIYSGLKEHKLFYVNAAFVIFTITLISRYFDTFWSLLDRSLFFIIGGLILIIGGFWLEKKRRQLGFRCLSQQVYQAQVYQPQEHQSRGVTDE